MIIKLYIFNLGTGKCLQRDLVFHNCPSNFQDKLYFKMLMWSTFINTYIETFFTVRQEQFCVVYKCI